MATTTSSLKLTKPDYSDSADIAVLNTNADTIDTAVSKIIPVISGTTNNSGYTIASGDYFEANGNLYKATASIATNSAWSSSATQLSSARGVVNEIDRAYDLGTVGTLASLESAIDTLGGSLVGGDQRKVKLSCSAAFGVFAQTYYAGTVSRTNTNRYQVILEQNGTNMVINGSKTSNGWEWDKLAFKNDIDTLSGKITNIPYGEYTGTQLTSSMDLHNLSNGRYLCISSSTASTSLNYPVAKGGYLDVVDRGNDGQKWLFYHTFTGEHYVQTYTAINSTWTNWEELAFNGNIEKINGGVDLGTLSSISAIETALNGKLSEMSNYEVRVLQLYYTGSTDGNFNSNRRYSCNLVRGSSVTYAFAELRCNNGAEANVTGYRGSNGWIWTGGFTKFRHLGAVSASSSKTINVAANTRAVVITIGSGGSKGLWIVNGTSSAGASVFEIASESSMSASASGSTITIVNSGVTSPDCFVIVFEGNVTE